MSFLGFVVKRHRPLVFVGELRLKFGELKRVVEYFEAQVKAIKKPQVGCQVEELICIQVVPNEFTLIEVS